MPGPVRADEPPAAAVLTGHRGPGRIRPPVPMPSMPVTLDNGTPTDLASVLKDRVTALQFVLTGCSSICPILGTIFARVQEEIGKSPDAPYQLLSFSLDPLGDSPQAFQGWLAKFNAGTLWHGAIPQTDQAGVVKLLKGWGLSSGTSSAFHTETVLLVDRQARLVYRFPDLPDPLAVVDLMQQVAAL
jgi:protein SCO1/2